MGCDVDFFEFFKKFEEDVREKRLITDRCEVGVSNRLKCYWRILEDELVHLLRAEKDDEGGILGFNSDTRTLIFFRRLIELTSNFRYPMKSERTLTFPTDAYVNGSLVDSYGIKWYRYYDLEDVDRLAASLARRLGLGRNDKMESGDASGNDQLETESEGFLTAKLTILSVLYSQYSADKSVHVKLSKDRKLVRNFTHNFQQAYEKEMAALEQDIKGLCGPNKKQEGGGVGRLLEKRLPLLLESIRSKTQTGLETVGTVFDNTRSKLYSRVLHYYLWVILLAKLFFICSRRLISMVLLLDHLLICLLDSFEDYLFMLISIQFTSEMLLTAIQQIIPLVM